MSEKWANPEDYWSTIGREAEDDQDVDDVPTTVMDRIVEQLEPERIHGIEFHGSNGRAYYGVVAYSGRHAGMDVLDLRTIVVDLRDDVVKVHDNGLWIPRWTGAAQQLTSVIARASNDLDPNSSTRDSEPLITSAIDASAEGILAHEIEDDYSPGEADGWGESWGNGQGPPDEVYQLVDRLEEADVPIERFSRLNFGEKKPFERYANRPVDELLGNYGVETGRWDHSHDRILGGDPLVIVDVDYPADAPIEALPETFAVSSASGSDERAHHYFRMSTLEDKQAVYDHFETGAVKPGWGDVWLFGEYVVGPGCISEDGDYQITQDVPIASLDASGLIDLLESSWIETDDEDEDEDVDDVEPGDALEDDRGDEPGVECHDCGLEIDPGTARLVDRDGTPAYICGGGCDE